MMPDGSRLHVVIPDITRRHMAVNVRKFVLQAASLDELVALETLTAQAAHFRFLWPAAAEDLRPLAHCRLRPNLGNAFVTGLNRMVRRFGEGVLCDRARARLPSKA